MKKILLAFFAFIAFSVCADAQTNKYVLTLKNGIDVECVSYKLTPDKNIEATYADGSTVTIPMDEIEKIVPVAAAKPEVEPIVLQPLDNTQQVQQARVYTADPVVYTQPTYAGPRKDPFIAGILSFLIPGVGQFYNGHVGAGIWFLVGSVSGLVLGNVFAQDGEYGIALVCYGLTLGLDIWAIVHAAKGANRVNAERGYALRNGNMYLKANPAVLGTRTLAAGGNYHYGMSVSLTF